MGLLPDQLYSLTPHELNLLAKGYREQENIKWRRSAFIAANIMNIHSKRKITIEKLLGEDSKKRKKISKDERSKKLQELQDMENIINGR